MNSNFPLPTGALLAANPPTPELPNVAMMNNKIKDELRKLDSSIETITERLMSVCTPEAPRAPMAQTPGPAPMPHQTRSPLVSELAGSVTVIQQLVKNLNDLTARLEI
jgi:hypothetical protein